MKIMAIVKVLELMASSTKSWEDAAQQAVDEASKSLKHIRSVYIQDQCAVVSKNKIVAYRVTAKLSFEIESNGNNSKVKK
jgi:dodecin